MEHLVVVYNGSRISHQCPMPGVAPSAARKMSGLTLVSAKYVYTGSKPYHSPSQGAAWDDAPAPGPVVANECESVYSILCPPHTYNHVYMYTFPAKLHCSKLKLLVMLEGRPACMLLNMYC